MSAFVSVLLVPAGWAPTASDPSAGAPGDPSAAHFAVAALRPGLGRVRFPWLAAAAVSGCLGSAVAGVVAALRLAGIPG